MHSSNLGLIATTVLATTAGADWIFTWPYSEDGSCRCEERNFGLETFLTEEDCLEAFVESEYEYCSYNGRVLVDKQCDFAVSVTEGLHNTHCAGKCSEVVAGLLPITEFMKECDLEVVVDLQVGVATLRDRCYTNNIYGWADYDPSGIQHAPLKFFENVATAARCQELCQDVPECASFVWRAVPDHDSTSTFQNEPHSCILYDAQFMNHAVSDPIPPSFGAPTEFCNVPAVGECAKISFPRQSFNIMEDQTCLYCGCEPRCVFYSPSHVSGPAFCQRGMGQLCDFTRPTWTTPEPECPTETCVPPASSTSEAPNTDEGTAVTDTALTTTAAAGGSTATAGTGLTQMTAQSDTALTSPPAGTAVPTVTVSLAGSTEETVTGVEMESTWIVGPPVTATVSETISGFDTPRRDYSTTGTGIVGPPATATVSETISGFDTPRRDYSTTGTGIVGPPATETNSAPETSTTVGLETTTSVTEETTTVVSLESSTIPEEGTSTTKPEVGGSTTSPGVRASTTAPGRSESTTVREANATTTGATSTAVGGTTSAAPTKSSPGECVPGCPDCPCFVESECDDCYSISDCMDDEC